MKKINIVKKNEDFRRIITTGKCKKGELFNIYIERNDEKIYRSIELSSCVSKTQTYAGRYDDGLLGNGYGR